MSVPSLVHDFYERIWNQGELGAALDLLSEGFVFRGSLGSESRGREAFLDYVRSVRNSLTNYQCEILDCVAEKSKAFAKMRFSGIHTGTFRGYRPTGMRVDWLGAALFHLANNSITELWVLGDLANLEGILRKNEDIRSSLENTSESPN